MDSQDLECPICHLRLPFIGLERHVNSHLDEAECARDLAFACELASLSDSSFQDAECSKDSGVTCTECREMVPLEDWTSHCLMHELQEQDYFEGYQRNHADCKDDGTEGPNICKKQRVEANKRASGNSTILVNGVGAQSLVTTQRKEYFKYVDNGIMNLLEKCLCSENQPFSCAIITGKIDHFESCASEDVGWGCGWRNIQMLSSHLLTQNWGAKETLFGGVGFVPDIPSLQGWLELAWACGFDEPGAQFYDYKIRSSKQWIGTAECAALFRFFGLRARIVDFTGADNRSKKEGQTSIERWLQGHSLKTALAQGREVHEVLANSSIHHDVECDLCGVYPLRGTRFKSKKKINYDICSVCLHSSDENPDDYMRIETLCNTEFKGKEVALDEDVNHQSLVDWVWNYFIGGITDCSLKACMDQLCGHVAVSECTPLYFQHQGHSRTIIGMQRRRKHTKAKEEVFLLVLDPSSKTEELERALRDNGQWQRLIKRGVHTLKKRSYQVCYMEPGIAQGEELEQLKNLTSEKLES